MNKQAEITNDANEKSENKPLYETYFASRKENLPIIRISKIELNGFKSVEHGTINLIPGKHSSEFFDIQPNILGIYGQNGSGKTSLIQALAILAYAMAGRTVDDTYTDCISARSGISTLAFSFDMQYLNGETGVIDYSFSLEKVEMTIEEKRAEYEKNHREPGDSFDESIFNDEPKYKIRIFNETVKISKNTANKKARHQTIVTTSGSSLPFGPNAKIQELIGKNKDAKIRLEINRETTSSESKSFIFSEKTLAIFVECGLAPDYYEALLALQYYAEKRLFVVDTRPYGLIGLNFLLPIHTDGECYLLASNRRRISVERYEKINNLLLSLSEVLSQLVPGLSIGFKKISETILKNGKPGYLAVLVAKRGDLEIPLRDESDGVRKIISILGLIIAAYNDPSITVAIDEFDAGIFEYLLGELLQSFEESGKGQFIFTSHNLRPLEVIDKKFLVFTTTNENNRYYRFKDLSSSNNLRDRYFRELILGGNDQEESLYNSTKRFKIESAMRKVYKK